jgi:hypothetical protein
MGLVIPGRGNQSGALPGADLVQAPLEVVLTHASTALASKALRGLSLERNDTMLPIAEFSVLSDESTTFPTTAPHSGQAQRGGRNRDRRHRQRRWNQWVGGAAATVEVRASEQYQKHSRFGHASATRGMHLQTLHRKDGET